MSTEKPKNKKDAGLGRGLESLLLDNSPDLSAKPQVIRRGEATETSDRRSSSDSLYKKEGAISYVKTPKRSRS